jgi:hypothetical protein
VTRIAVSGHRGLLPDVAALIDKAVRAELAPVAADGQLVGLTCLADGADQIFARAVLDLGGQIEVYVPAAKYRDGLPADARPTYDQLLSRAAKVYRLDHHDSTAESHMDASVAMLVRADRLLAVWDGQPARALGGTADVVEHARSRGLPITVIWPEGARRD